MMPRVVLFVPVSFIDLHRIERVGIADVDQLRNRKAQQGRRAVGLALKIDTLLAHQTAEPAAFHKEGHLPAVLKAFGVFRGVADDPGTVQVGHFPDRPTPVRVAKTRDLVQGVKDVFAPQRGVGPVHFLELHRPQRVGVFFVDEFHVGKGQLEHQPRRPLLIPEKGIGVAQ